MAILITGASGFLGRYIVDAVSRLSYTTLGFSGCDYNVDLSTNVPEFIKTFSKVIHAAGLAHVQHRSKESDRRFFEVNKTGTANLLEGLEKLPQLPKSFIFISTVAVYGIDEGESIDETAPLDGSSPYALSKVHAEDLIKNWGEKHNVNTLILRLPLIAGANPPGNLGALIKAIRKGYYFRIGDGSARRSMVLAEDIAKFVAAPASFSGTYNLTDGYHPSVRELESAIATRLNKKIKQVPSLLANALVRAGDLLPLFPINTVRFRKLTSTLTFSDAKARNELNWNPRPVLENLQI